jgi:hypothetical protein
MVGGCTRGLGYGSYSVAKSHTYGLLLAPKPANYYHLSAGYVSATTVTAEKLS